MTLRAGIAAALLTAGVAAAAPASAATTLPEDGVLQQRVRSFCERAPKLEQRGEKLQQRLAADAETRGSLAWLEKRVQAVEKDRRRDRLDLRLERRRELAGKLPERLERLRQAQQECTKAGLT